MARFRGSAPRQPTAATPTRGPSLELLTSERWIEAKSEHGYRALDIGPKLVDVLHARVTEQEFERASAPEWEDNDLLFCHPVPGPRRTPPGRWWYPDHPTRAIAKLIDASGLPRIRPLQDLRHSHASILLASGEPPKVVQERLGHHSTAFTQDTYQHLLPGMGAAAARRFEDLVLDAEDTEDEHGTERP